MIWLERLHGGLPSHGMTEGLISPTSRGGRAVGFTVILGHMESAATKRKAHGRAGHPKPSVGMVILTERS